MLLVKENVMNLGFLISCCCGGGFLLLFLYYLWFCTLSFVQIVKELEFVYKMGHFQEGKLNLHEYQRMNVPELGAEYFRRDEGFAQAADYRHPYNKKYIDDKLHARFNPESNYPDVLARPVF
ncbi:hypothetical protein ANN_17372 [Periplaneta americana]|uniref:Uncharacterized protein n=1 Tax=Periplaneta americana TaxID=6978 RepID=A0ABQ8SU68_PERAM|nr:hypothetical protein ANN_17372 [Periplaneta americana]